MSRQDSLSSDPEPADFEASEISGRDLLEEPDSPRSTIAEASSSAVRTPSPDSFGHDYWEKGNRCLYCKAELNDETGICINCLNHRIAMLTSAQCRAHDDMVKLTVEVKMLNENLIALEHRTRAAPCNECGTPFIGGEEKCCPACLQRQMELLSTWVERIETQLRNALAGLESMRPLETLYRAVRSTLHPPQQRHPTPDALDSGQG